MAVEFKNEHDLFMEFETSAWTDNESIKEVFDCVAKEIVRRKLYTFKEKPKPTLRKFPKEEAKEGCCSQF